MERKTRWGKEKARVTAQPVLPTRRTDYSIPHAICIVIENYFTIAECQRYLGLLGTELEWKNQSICVVGRGNDTAVVDEPRLTLFMAEAGICYEYSGRDNVGKGWHPAVLEIKRKAEQALIECGLDATTFNCVQFNRYEGNRHTLGFHADNEPDLVVGAPIASISFGATRNFVIKDKENDDNRWVVPLADGSFMCMGGSMQQRYLHAVPAGGTGGVRLNLTFRVCIPRKPRDSLLSEGSLAQGIKALSLQRLKNMGDNKTDSAETNFSQEEGCVEKSVEEIVEKPLEKLLPPSERSPTFSHAQAGQETQAGKACSEEISYHTPKTQLQKLVQREGSYEEQKKTPEKLSPLSERSPRFPQTQAGEGIRAGSYKHKLGKWVVREGSYEVQEKPLENLSPPSETSAAEETQARQARFEEISKGGPKKYQSGKHMQKEGSYEGHKCKEMGRSSRKSEHSLWSSQAEWSGWHHNWQGWSSGSVEQHQSAKWR